jgi:hypothetical protein
VGRICGRGEIKYAYNIFNKKNQKGDQMRALEFDGTLLRPIKMDIKQFRREYVVWIQVAQDEVQWTISCFMTNEKTD